MVATEKPLTTFEFLEKEVYLPGYMTLASADYDDKQRAATFSIVIREPVVARGNIVDYFTPRGLHICVSQAGIALVEHMIERGEIDGLEIQAFREITLQGRLKITELYQRWRKEVKSLKLIQSRFCVSRFRAGQTPVLKLDFDFAERAVCGNLTSVIARNPVPQLNADIIRF